MKREDYRREMNQVIFSETLEEDIIERLRQYREMHSGGEFHPQGGRRKRAGMFYLKPAAAAVVVLFVAGAVFCQTSAGKMVMEKVHRTMADMMGSMFRGYESSSAGAVEQIGLEEKVGGNKIKILEAGLTGTQMILRIREETDGKDKLDMMALFSSLSGKGLSDWGDYHEWDREQGSLYECIENKETGEYILMKSLDEGVTAGELLGKELTYRMTLQTMPRLEGGGDAQVEVYGDINDKKEVSFRVAFSGQLQEHIVPVHQSISLEDGTSMLVKECGCNGIYAWVTYETPHSLLQCMEDLQERMDTYFEEHSGDSLENEKVMQEIYQGYYYAPALYNEQGGLIGEAWDVQNEKRVSGDAEKDLFALEHGVKEFIVKPVKVELNGSGQGIKTELQEGGIPVNLDGR